MKVIYSISKFLILIFIFISYSCTKDFLNTKPESDLIIPSTLSDLQKLIDNDNVINLSPVLGEVSSDDYYMNYDSWRGMFSDLYRNVYIWAPDIFNGTGGIQDWNALYKEVLYSNIIIEKLNEIEKNSSNINTWNNIKGSALFIRALAFFNLAREFSPMYDSSQSGSDLGIPLKLSSDVNDVPERATLEDTYNQILSDAIASKELLPSSFPYNNRNRPSKQAAMALLARIYLSVGAYKSAGIYADSTLNLYDKLIDYNTLDTTSNSPFTIDNQEVIYQLRINDSDPTIFVTSSEGYSIDSMLYKSYSYNDLRRSLYFTLQNNYINFKGSYYGSRILSNALTTDEMYLIKAESQARAGNIKEAMDKLNVLLLTRWKRGTFIPYEVSNEKDALNIILRERRKELVMRGLRWTDLKRLNKEGYNIILKRVLNNTTYELNPNDPKYIIPIPPDVIALSGIKQNKR